MEYNVSVVGFGDNVVDIYTHSNKQYPGGNCVNFAVYAKMFGAKRRPCDDRYHHKATASQNC